MEVRKRFENDKLKKLDVYKRQVFDLSNVAKLIVKSAFSDKMEESFNCISLSEIEVSLSIGVEQMPTLSTIGSPAIVRSISIGNSVIVLIFDFFNIELSFIFVL